LDVSFFFSFQLPEKEVVSSFAMITLFLFAEHHGLKISILIYENGIALLF